ncbi:MAG: Asp-tRNA(Asn)/Glu-tRNA(Gln) amidotransferase subunit GatB [Armatimonadota bacterium]
MAYRPMVGLEVHAQLLTDAKMFCGCAAEFGADPNSNCCPICTGMPGSLPVPNRRAVEFVIRTGLALGCSVADYCRFYRKNYFYPDLAKNFQISQYDEPLTFGGSIDLQADGEPFTIRIRRAHLEEDTGKNIHLPDGRSLVEYNRSGVPLMEIVTEPDFTSAEQVREYLVQLRRILRYLGVSTANMEEGAMRCEPTVNLVDEENDAATPKVEIKNLASFKAVYQAVKYEIDRQRWCLENDSPMQQETRRWNETDSKTTVMRTKESAEDYMYFPEPDLVPLQPDSAWVEEIRAELPELPRKRQQRFIDEFDLPEYDAGVLTESKQMADFFEAAATACGNPKAVSNWVMGDLSRMLNETGDTPETAPVEPQQLADLIRLIDEGTISNDIAQDIFPDVYNGADPESIIEERGLSLISDTGELEALVVEAIEANPQAAEDFRGGRDKALGAMMGYIMGQTQGQADARLVNEMLREKLNE